MHTPGVAVGVGAGVGVGGGVKTGKPSVAGRVNTAGGVLAWSSRSLTTVTCARAGELNGPLLLFDRTEIKYVPGAAGVQVDPLWKSVP